MGNVVVIAALLGLIPAFIGKAKGDSFFSWWLFGAAFFILALPAVLLRKPLRAVSGGPDA